MDRKSVVSSNINSIGYDENEQILEVEFKGGSVYQYKNVDKDVYDNLMNADSHGRYFSKYIRNIYLFRKIS